MVKIHGIEPNREGKRSKGWDVRNLVRLTLKRRQHVLWTGDNGDSVMSDTNQAATANSAPVRMGSSFGLTLINRIRNIDTEILMRKVMWNLVLLFLGLFVGFIVIQHAMFYSLPPNLDEFLYVQKEVYVIFSLMFVISIRTLFFVEGKIRSP
ncbi:MAG: hypothetical protein V3U09_02285 [Thermoplasmata archaeon]